MALQPSIRVINGRVFGAYAAQAKNIAYGQGTVEDALDAVNENLDILNDRYANLGSFIASDLKSFILQVMRAVKNLTNTIGLGETCFIRAVWHDHNYYCGVVCKSSTYILTYRINVSNGQYLYCGDYSISNDAVDVYLYTGSLQ